MSDTTDQRFAPPQAHVEDLATGERVLAGRGARFVAAIVDGVLLAAVIWAIFMIPVLKPWVEAHEKGRAENFWQFDPWSAVLGFTVFLVIQGWPLLKRGQTVGKMLLKMRIVRTDGSKPDAWRLLGLRYGIGLLIGMNAGASMVYGLIDSLLIFRESRKCLHDSIADTVVIKL